MLCPGPVYWYIRYKFPGGDCSTCYFDESTVLQTADDVCEAIVKKHGKERNFMVGGLFSCFVLETQSGYEL